MEEFDYVPLVKTAYDISRLAKDAMNGMRPVDLYNCRSAIQALAQLDHFLTSGPFAGSGFNVVLGMAIDETITAYKELTEN